MASYPVSTRWLRWRSRRASTTCLIMADRNRYSVDAKGRADGVGALARRAHRGAARRRYRGGRQLDGTRSSAAALPAVVAAIGDRAEVYVDSGIRSGMDVLKMLAVGAKACFIGRAYLYGLGADGEAGVTKALELIHKELSTAMR